ncbi:hypothetical protein [Cohaesibacter intestini]|uniref:hypothetical protein n=1 Tax=Cohaesibacter intestini TaxID=2211145 RepID=UPI000DE9B19B|nr:hypothetical protein [Cohaesibacter intestini]
MADAARQITYAGSNDEPALVVITKDVSGVARGSWFAASDAKVAKASAKAAGSVAVVVKGTKIMGLAQRVPKGRIFDSGKLFMPRIQGEVFDKLMGFAPQADKAPQLQLVASSDADSAGSSSEASVASSASVIEGKVPDEWSKLGVGSLVLARDVEEESFYLAVIIGKTGPINFTLRWRDYTDEPNFQRQVSDLAMLHPKVDLNQFDWEYEE